MMVRLHLIALVCFVFAVAVHGQESRLDYATLQKTYESEKRPLAFFSSLSEQHPRNAWVFHFLGLSEEESGHDAAAQAAFEKAQSLEPNQAWHWQTLGNHWSGRSEYGRAASCYDKAAELEQRPEPKDSLRRQAAGALKRADTRRAYQEEDATASTRILLLGAAGLLVLAALCFFLR